jgi:hypothetical protein
MRSAHHKKTVQHYRLWSSALVMGGFVSLLVASVGLAAEAPGTIDPKAAEFFEAKVRPILHKNCFPCHGEKQQMGSLRLDSLANMLKGNSGGPAIVVGYPDKSPLIQVIRYDGKIKMPPTGKLKPEEIQALTLWVEMGAPWPRSKISDAAKQAMRTGEYVITPEQRKFWSFQPVRKPALPKVRNEAWVKTPIDAFILFQLEKKGLQPAPPADRRTLLRRAYYDLIGLPPTAEETAAFLADKSPNAFAKVIDRLLASPHYGERWARYWLDVARYADTKGYVFTEDRNYYNAYTYRDYVIRAFNEDLPYDQFILHQIAADRLPLGEDRRPLAAIGYLTVGRRFLNNIHDIIDDRIDVVMRGFQGLTVNCARCHDHKYDPISTKDYYALYGIFASSVEPNPPPSISPKSIAEPYAAHTAKLSAVEKQVHDLLQSQIGRLRQMVEKEPEKVLPEVKKILQGFRVGELPKEEDLVKLLPYFENGSPEKLKALREEVEALKKKVPPAPEFAMALEDSPNPRNTRVFIRGNPNNQGPEVPRRFLQILAGDNPPSFTQGSGRLELAQAIASKSNPLTARVMVNRIWMHHFGEGLVRTPSDFGTRGEPPTHPKLLDYLASWFMENGWSIKKLHRLIMFSSAYQQSSEINPRYARIDPENRLLWRMNRRRLDLEALRDSLLYVAGRLDMTVGGKSVELTTQPYSTRRTIYGFIDRQNLQGLYRTFDFASPDTTTAKRYQTTVPQQALFMMNSPFVVEQAQCLAKRQEVVEAKDEVERIHRIYRMVFARSPNPAEVSLGLRFLQRDNTPIRQVAMGEEESVTLSKLSKLEQYVQVLLMTNEFCFVD